MSIPKRIRCPACNGTGEIWLYGEEEPHTCGDCDETGEIEADDTTTNEE